MPTTISPATIRPAPLRTTLAFPPGSPSLPGCVRSARDLTDLALRSCGYPDNCVARILVSVLVIASLLHADPSAGEPVAVTVTVLPGRLQVDVTSDGNDGWPAPRRVPGQAAETRGSSLRLVDQLSDAWGYHRDGGRLTTWFEILVLLPPMQHSAVTAVNWASRIRRDWTTYLAARVKVSTPAPGKT